MLLNTTKKFKTIVSLTIVSFLIIISFPALAECDCGYISSIHLDNKNEPVLTTEDIKEMQQQALHEGWTYSIAENSATRRPLNELCGFVIQEKSIIDANFNPCLPTRDFPVRFDWRELGGVPPIRDQGKCGSCWAFATLSPLESNILIKHNVEVDLSEQWLVSCNVDGMGCVGGYWAHDYLQWKAGKCGGIGAVLEEDFRYTEMDSSCRPNFDHLFLIDDWKYIGNGMYGLPNVSSIKQAILQYGPISAGVAANFHFILYSGGVFNGPTCNIVNHAVTLVG